MDLGRQFTRLEWAGVILVTVLACTAAVCEYAPEGCGGRSARDRRAGEHTHHADVAAHQAERRIVSLGGTVSEVVYALGAGPQVVAVDKSSLYPEATQEVRKLDLFRQVSAEAVLAFEPTLVLATDAAKPDQALERIAQAGVRVVRVDSMDTPQAAKARILAVGEALGRRDEARSLVDELEADFAAATAAARACAKPARTLFFYARSQGTMFVAGPDTSAGRMIALAGGTPVPGGIEGFKPMTPEAVVEANPDVVLMTDTGLASVGGADGLADIKGLRQSRAVETGHIVTMGDLELLGFGPRAGKAAFELAKSLCLDGRGAADER